MKKYIWILSGMAMLALIIYACTSDIKEEKIIASVENIPSDLSFGWESEELSITGYDKTFTFVSDAGWCTVSGDKIKVESNQVKQSREASVNVNWKNETMKTIRIRQLENGFIGILNVTPTSINAENAANTYSIDVTSNISWTATSSESWCSITPASGSGNSSILVNVSTNNNESSRTATITIVGGDITRTVSISQEGNKFLNVTPTSINCYAGYYSVFLYVESNISWTATSSQSWCKISSSSASGSNNERVYISFGLNETKSPRFANITIAGEGISRTVSAAQENGNSDTAPSNDQCSGATSLPCGSSLNGTTVGATSKKTILPNIDISWYGVWYTFIGDNRQTTISVTPISAGYDIRIAVFKGSCSSLTYVGNMYDMYKDTQVYSFNADSDTRYYIYIAECSPTISCFTGKFSISRSCP